MLLLQSLWADQNLIKSLQKGNVVVMPTDTLYGIVGKASDASVVERIYTARKRTPLKPCIILIGKLNELDKFSISLSDEQKNKLQEYWKEDSLPTSIVLDCLDEKFTYLHRGTNTLAFRLPNNKQLCDLLLKTGPLTAPSANIEGLPPAENITQAKNYFKDMVDLYVDAGEIKSKASRVIRLEKDGSVVVLRG